MTWSTTNAEAVCPVTGLTAASQKDSVPSCPFAAAGAASPSPDSPSSTPTTPPALTDDVSSSSRSSLTLSTSSRSPSPDDPSPNDSADPTFCPDTTALAHLHQLRSQPGFHIPLPLSTALQLFPNAAAHLTAAASTPTLYDPTPLDTALTASLHAHLRPTTSTPWSTPYPTAFTWSAVAAHLSSTAPPTAPTTHTWTAIAFRSRRRRDINSPRLFLADLLAQTEASLATSGALLAYWYSDADAVTGDCLATCVWADGGLARSVNGLPLHRGAVGLAREAYAWYGVERWEVGWRRDEGFAFTRVAVHERTLVGEA
ncbi:hypothetical protein HDU96_011101 [Phlyctochytrium bullatum]|nr:hypothetical protein HDU96_011101 [Phlyctochytrium bullatum]